MGRPDCNDRDLPLSVLLAEWPGLAPVFWDRKMLCPGCPIAPFHTLADACDAYGLDEATLRAALLRAQREG